jgi:predicted RND superfamily exporter protein
MKRFTEFVVQYRLLVIGAVLLVTAFLGFQVTKIQVNSDIIDSLPDHDPDAVLLKEIGERFGGNRIGMVILETDNIYQTEILNYVLQITDSLTLVPGIASITSLTTMMEIRNDEFGFEVGTLVDPYEMPESPDELANLRNRIESNDLYRGSIVSEDGTSTIIIFSLEQGADVEEVTNEVRSKTAQMNLPVNLFYAGSPMMVTAVGNIISRDMKMLIPITFGIISLILFLGFRSFRGVVLPLLSAALAIVWTIGLMALGGYQMSMISSNIPILLVAIGSAYSIHVINRVRQSQLRNEGVTVQLALQYIAVPVFLAAITTAVGFVSFLFGAYLAMIRDYGVFTAVGTMISCLLSLTFVPAVLSVTRKPGHVVSEELADQSFLARYVLDPVNTLLFQHTRKVFVVWGALILASVGGMLLIKREVDVKDYFKKKNPTRIAEEIMIEKFGGTKPVFVHFRGDVNNPDMLQTMQRTEEYMKASPDIVTTQSVANLMAEMNAALGEERKIPDERDRVEQLWFLLEGNEYLSTLVTPEMDEAIIVSKFVNSDNASKIQFDEYMSEYLSSIQSDEFDVRMTGMPFVDVTLDNSLVRSQIGSLVIAVVFVVLIVGLILRSLKLGIIATAPIIAAILILFGVMGIVGISLNIGTVLVASVALGIGIDYSIHMISHFRHAMKNGLDVHMAIRDAIMISGKAIAINVASVSAGFMVLIFSQMVPLQYFGLLVAISMVGSSLGALTLLPSILIWTNGRKNRGVS